MGRPNRVGQKQNSKRSYHDCATRPLASRNCLYETHCIIDIFFKREIEANLRQSHFYSNNYSCYITSLDFLDFVTFFDFLSIFFHLIWQIRDGGNESSPSLGRYCGTTLPRPFRAAGNQMWVKFVTDSNVTRTGFRATYSSGYTSLYLSASLPIHLSQSLSLSLVLTVWICARVQARLSVRV